MKNMKIDDAAKESVCQTRKRIVWAITLLFIDSNKINKKHQATYKSFKKEKTKIFFLFIACIRTNTTINWTAVQLLAYVTHAVYHVTYMYRHASWLTEVYSVIFIYYDERSTKNHIHIRKNKCKKKMVDTMNNHMWLTIVTCRKF